MYTLYTFVTMKCNTCNKATNFEPGLYSTPMKPSCKCNEVIDTPKKTTRKRAKKVVEDEK